MPVTVIAVIRDAVTESVGFGHEKLSALIEAKCGRGVNPVLLVGSEDLQPAALRNGYAWEGVGNYRPGSEGSAIPGGIRKDGIRFVREKDVVDQYIAVV